MEAQERLKEIQARYNSCLKDIQFLVIDLLKEKNYTKDNPFDAIDKMSTIDAVTDTGCESIVVDELFLTDNNQIGINGHVYESDTFYSTEYDNTVHFEYFLDIQNLNYYGFVSMVDGLLGLT